MPRFVQLSVILLIPALVFAQTPEATAPEAVLHIASRLVYVDVVVRDAKGQVVHGLSAPDFVLKEDGVEQKISFFNEHLPELPDEAAGNAAPQTKFSNVTPQGAPKSMLILLFDLLNTANDDQLTARQQMLKFLGNLPPGQRVTLFTLTNEMKMVQGTTGSPALLAAASSMLKPRAILSGSQSESLEDQQIAANAAAQFGRHPGASTSMENSGPASDNHDYEVRAMRTISALSEVAKEITDYPGRKSLYWLAESYPLSVDVAGPPVYTSVMGGTQQFNNSLIASQSHFNQTSQQEMRTTLNALATARIAVYPTSVLGLTTRSATAAISGSPMVNSDPGDPRGGFFTVGNLRTEMNNLAEATGGESVWGSNDIAGAMHHSLDDNASYYTLAYRPSNSKWDGQFRQIHLDVTGGSSLIYRRGYFAFANGPQDNKDSDQPRDLLSVLAPSLPEVTALRLHSQILPTDPQHPGLQIQSTIDARDVDFTADADGHEHAKLFVQMVAYSDADKQPKNLPQTSGTLNIDLAPAQYQYILKAGIAYRQQLALKPGKYHVLAGVSDENSHKMGTVEMPLEVTGQ